MITYRWAEELGALRDDVRGLVDEAAHLDAEAGFSTARPDLPPEPGGVVRHLLVEMPPRGQRGSPRLDALPDIALVAYARVEVRAGVAHAQLVVREAFRSLGIATLLAERLASESEGWSALGVTSVRAWAHGLHPAAERASWRVAATLDEAVVKLVRPLYGDDVGPLAIAATASPHGFPAVAPGHAAAIAPEDARLAAGPVSVVGGVLVGDVADLAGWPSVRVAVPPAQVADVVRSRGLATAAACARSRGAAQAVLYVDPTDDVLLRAARLDGFSHDQTDALFRLDLSATP